MLLMWLRGAAGIIWEVFQHFSAVGQELAASAGFVPGLYLVAVGLKLLGYVMRANALADVSTNFRCMSSGACYTTQLKECWAFWLLAITVDCM